MAGGFCWLRWTITETGCPAGWSRSMAALKAARPDRRGGGRRMYFSVAVGGNFHIWRQRWGSGEPEQITFGPTEEEGIAIAADGSSLITSIGMRQSAIWIHDASGDREISSDGLASYPAFSSDSTTIYWLRRESINADAELWAVNLTSGKSEPVLPGVAMDSYAVS